MGDKVVGKETDGEQASSYSIVAFPAMSLPSCYEGFVQATWKRSLRDGNELYRLIDSKRYFDAYAGYVKRLIATPGAVIRVAILSDDPDVALGWSLISGEILHYVFVKRDARNKGIAKALVPVTIGWISHMTNTGIRIWNKHKHVRFDPFV